MTIQVFLAMLLACSLFTSLTVEGIKKVTEGMQARQRPPLWWLCRMVLKCGAMDITPMAMATDGCISRLPTTGSNTLVSVPVNI